MSEHKENSSGFFTGVLLGSIAGASAFFLFGTKQGRKVKKILIKEGKKLLSELEDLSQDLEKERAKKSQEMNPPHRRANAVSSFRLSSRLRRDGASSPTQESGDSLKPKIKELQKATTTKIDKVKNIIPRRFFHRNGQELK